MPPRNSRWMAAKKARECKVAKAAKLKMQENIEKGREINHDDQDICFGEQENQIVKRSLFMKSSPPCVVLGTLLAGTTYKSTRTILLMNGVKPCCRSTFYSKQAEIGPKIVALAKQTCTDAMIESVALGNRQFSQDSIWSSPRHGKENTFLSHH